MGGGGGVGGLGSDAGSGACSVSETDSGGRLWEKGGFWMGNRHWVKLGEVDEEEEEEDDGGSVGSDAGGAGGGGGG